MTQQSNNNKTIIRNTIFMYFRMIVTIIIGLYASRVIINTLGIDGYGLYNIVGGIVVLFSFISNALRNSTQRFLSFELGKKANYNIQKVFNSALQCHLYICLGVLIFAETIGLWFTCTQLNIPSSQEYTVQYVYQFSIITFILQLIQVPYNSLIISYEKMGFYAYLSIIEALMKLGILYFLVVLSFNKVILYSALVSAVSLIVLVIYVCYCHKKLGLHKFQKVTDNRVLKEIISFSKWSMFSGGSNILSQQGGNYLVNIFSGVAANASFGIANQVSNIIYGFVSNFQTAFQPQIVKRYASNETSLLMPLIMRSSLISYYLLLIIALPFCIDTNYIIGLWLGIVPEYSGIFTVLLLVSFLIDSIQAPLWMLIYSSGSIKRYTLITGVLTILNFPLSWLLLLLGLPIYSIFVVRVIISIICSAYRIKYVQKHENFPVKIYIKEVLSRSLTVTFLSLSIILAIVFLLKSQILHILFSICVIGIIVLLTGFNKADKNIIIKMILSKIPKL